MNTVRKSFADPRPRNRARSVAPPPPRVDALCPIGAGDALAAAFAWAMVNHNNFEDAVRWGVAAGTAKAKLPGVSFASLQETEHVYKLVEMRTA